MAGKTSTAVELSVEVPRQPFGKHSVSVQINFSGALEPLLHTRYL